jgi:serine protease AprX
VQNEHRIRWRRAALAALVAALVGAFVQPAAGAAQAGPMGSNVAPALAQRAAAHQSSTYSVIVRERHPASPAAEALVRSTGGRVTKELPLIGAFAATITGRGLARLASAAAIRSVWSDGRVHMASAMSRYDSTPPNTVWQKVIGLPNARKHYTGLGVTVALLDTGVIQSPDLGDRVVARVDLTPDHDGFDRFGHGTHMAGIIAGDGTSSAGKWTGVAPKAKLVSVKVAGADGSTDVSEVIAGLQWIYSHRGQYGIRVLNLSFGTDGIQPYLIDPLDFAVERLWKAGILVVVAAGNGGLLGLAKPGEDAFVVTVGAADLKNTTLLTDDVVAPFSAVGPTLDGLVKPDLVAPGTSIVSNRDPGSTIDWAYPDAVVDTNYFKGTGTSQAAAVISGVAALMFQARPTMTPDVAKATLMGTTLANLKLKPGAGAGLVNADTATTAAKRGTYVTRPANVGAVPSTGLGSIDASRGSSRPYADLNGDGVMDPIAGEIDVLGRSWDYNGWGTNWSGQSWNSNAWSGYESVGISWGGATWGGMSWDGTSWDGNSWDGMSWDGNSWDGNSWDGNSWDGASWDSVGW